MGYFVPLGRGKPWVGQEHQALPAVFEPSWASSVLLDMSARPQQPLHPNALVTLAWGGGGEEKHENMQ